MESINSSEYIGLDFEYQELTENRAWIAVPELRLVWATIERSVRDVVGNQLADATAAIDWFKATETPDPDSYSFQWCCETLEINPKVLREKILKLHSQPKAPRVVKARIVVEDKYLERQAA